MVDKLKLAYEQMKSVMSGLNTSQKVTLYVGALMIFVALSGLVMFATTTQYEVLVDVTKLEQKERQEIDQILKDEGIKHRLEGNVMSIESGRRKDIVMKLNLDQNMPGDKDAFSWLAEITPLNSPDPKVMGERLRMSRARELESVINSFPWVRNSQVTITLGNDLDVIKGRRHLTKAMVNILSRGQKSADFEQVRAVRSLVSYAVPKLKGENVGIVVDGEPFIFKKKTDEKRLSDEWMAKKIELEEYYVANLREFFMGADGNPGLVRRMRVAVNVEIDREVIESDETTRAEGTNIVRVSEGGVSTKGKGATLDEIGVNPNTATASNVQDGDSLFDHTETQKNIENRPEILNVRKVKYIPGAQKSISVAIVFDVNELIIPSGAKDFKEGKDDAQILTEKLQAFKVQAAKAIGITDAGITNISVDAMEFAIPDLPDQPSVGAVVMDVLENSGGHFLVFGLSLFGFLYFVNVLRQAFETPELEEDMDEEEIKRRTTDEDVARMLDAQSQSMEDIRARQVEERVRRMVADDPESAGSLVKRWMSQDEDK